MTAEKATGMPLPPVTNTSGPAGGLRIGPFQLAPGVRRSHFWTLLYSSFITIGMLAGINLLQGYVLTEHLQVPPLEQGTVSGNLAFWQEIIAILLIAPCGVLADRIGRRPVMVAGMLIIAIGFALYPFATSVAELTACRAFFAIGAAALAALIGVVTNDYPAESSRGKMQGLNGVMSAFGVLFLSLVVAQIPAFLRPRGVDPVTAGRVMFLSAALLCLGSALVLRLGLRPGTGAAPGERRGWAELLASGWRAGRNPRVRLSYACAFTGRGDNALKGTFVALWALLAAPAAGLTVAEALARAGQLIGFMGLVALAWTPLLGYLLDRLNRVTGVALAMGLASAGFLSMTLITSPLDFAMLPAFALLSIGQVSAVIASVTLVGQEAEAAERGSVVAMNGWFGAVGILVAASIGGRLFDSIGPSAPFVMFGMLQLVLAIVAVWVRIRSPGL
jgi:MFS family permease